MTRPSSIDQLPPELRQQINHLRVDEGYTIEQIVEFLKTMNAKISKSAMGRHVRKLAEVGERIRQARAIAEGVAPTLAGKDDGQLLNLNNELLQAAIMRIASATDEDGNDVELTAMQAMALGKALESSSKAVKINADRILKIRQETAKLAVKAVEEVVKNDAPGLSADTLAKIKKQVLGVVG
ncbi:MAG: phage protein Gp27 family protein [Rhizomicrobium sp.]